MEDGRLKNLIKYALDASISIYRARERSAQYFSVSVKTFMMMMKKTTYGCFQKQESSSTTRKKNKINIKKIFFLFNPKTHQQM